MCVGLCVCTYVYICVCDHMCVHVCVQKKLHIILYVCASKAIPRLSLWKPKSHIMIFLNLNFFYVEIKTLFGNSVKYFNVDVCRVLYHMVKTFCCLVVHSLLMSFLHWISFVGSCPVAAPRGTCGVFSRPPHPWNWHLLISGYIKNHALKYLLTRLIPLLISSYLEKTKKATARVQHTCDQKITATVILFFFIIWSQGI